MTLCTLPKTEPAGHASQLTALQPTVDDDDDNEDDDDDGDDDPGGEGVDDDDDGVAISSFKIVYFKTTFV